MSRYFDISRSEAANESGQEGLDWAFQTVDPFM